MDTSQSPPSLDSEVNGNLSPSQKIAYRELEKRNIKPSTIAQYTKIIAMVMPDAAKGIEGMFILIQNPEELHRALEEIVVKLQEVIESDHEFGIHSKRDNAEPKGELERVNLSSSGIRSGEERNGKVDSSGSPDEGISAGLFQRETASSDSDNRYEAEI